MQQNQTDETRRTAGGGRGSAGDPVRDWQRNTWYGPAPSNGNPFDEPEDAPELRDSRSPNVNEHMGDFWNQEYQGYQYTGSSPKTTQAAREKKGPEKKKRSTGKQRAARVLAGIGALAAVLLFLRFGVFSVRAITVIGNRDISTEEIIRISGIHWGDSMIRLNEKQVRERIESDYRLQFGYLKKNLPNQVTLNIREREECCWFTYGGILYQMDKNRMVLSETESLFEEGQDAQGQQVQQETADFRRIRSGLVQLKGLNIRSGCRVGQRLMLAQPAQQTAISNLFLEMKVLGCAEIIQEADVSNPSGILLVTRDGFTVVLGNQENLHAKLRSMLLVRAELIRMGYSSGTITVTNPRSPLYSPVK